VGVCSSEATAGFGGEATVARCGLSATKAGFMPNVSVVVDAGFLPVSFAMFGTGLTILPVGRSRNV